MDSAYVQDMWRLSPVWWNSLCGNVEPSHISSLFLSPTEGTSASAHRQCTEGDTHRGRALNWTGIKVRPHLCVRPWSSSPDGPEDFKLGPAAVAGPEKKPERDSRGHGYSWRDLVQRICNLHFKHTLKSVPGRQPRSALTLVAEEGAGGGGVLLVWPYLFF